MTEGSFSHALIWNNPIAAMCFFAFAMSFISLWVRKTAWLWGSFLLIAYILAFTAKIADVITLMPVLILLFCHYFLKKDIHKGARFLLFGIATLVSFALIFHLLPGFKNWRLATHFIISPPYPYCLWLNFDKPFIGIFALAFSIPLISSRTQLFKVMKKAIPLSMLGILIMMGLALHFGLVKWDFKIPVFFFIWLIDNLIFVVIPEEAFFRGFVQQEIYRWFGTNSFAGAGSIFFTSLMFTLAHIMWVSDLGFLGAVFLASVIYGSIYQITKSIEASILCHFGLNVIHFIFFSYPALQNCS